MEKNKLGFYMGSAEKIAYTIIHDNSIQLMVGLEYSKPTFVPLESTKYL